MIIIFAFIIFLFTLFVLAKDDFVFLRRNVSLTILFDITFLSGMVSLFLARLAYVFIHPSSSYLNPLVFFVIPYFPGLSTVGFLLGAYIPLYFFTRKQKIPTGRVYDIFSLALLPAVGCGFLLQAGGDMLHKQLFPGGIALASGILLFVFFLLLRIVYTKSSFKDGPVAILGVFLLSVTLFLGDVVGVRFKSLPIELPYFILLFFLLLISFLVTLFKKAGERT